MSVFTGDNNKMLKATGIGVFLSVVFTAILSCLFALILNYLSGIPYGIIDYAAVGIEGISVFFGAYIAAAIVKFKGLIVGVLCAVTLYILTAAISLGSGSADIGVISIIRAAVLLICGIGGGILGVNKKERIKIH